MSLLLHCGAFSATYSDLLASQLPSATSTYEPIPHHEIVDTVLSTAADSGLTVKRSLLRSKQSRH
ncbi:MAG: hypothetical protein KME17_23835 [Cyanosarcina radialis HA8281-LM2]|jgi:hypothetical protein|nr:hypothetical protein [Cyanosarcina radialis HA8281-LM2]